MTDKAKRRPHPRRRLLMQISVLLALVSSIIAAGYFLLRPAGEQIVYLRPDRNYGNKLWIADLNNPENPRQLSDDAIAHLQVVNGTGQIAYITRVASENRYEIWLVNARTGEKRQIATCTSHCYFVEIHSNGRWLAYRTGYSDIHIIDLQTSRQVQPDREQLPAPLQTTPGQQWIGASGLLLLGTYEQSSVAVLYDMASGQIIEQNTWYPPGTIVHFSPDGQYFVAENETDGTLTIRSDANPAAILSEFSQQSPLIFHGWHPDSTRILFTESSGDTDDDRVYSLYLYNILTGERTLLMPRNRDSVHDNLNTFQFNAAGTRILYQEYAGYHYSGIDRIGVLDLESREPVILPLSGNDPQWVNG